MSLKYRFHWGSTPKMLGIGDSAARLAPNHTNEIDGNPIEFEVTDDSMATLDSDGIFKGNSVTCVPINQSDLLEGEIYVIGTATDANLYIFVKEKDGKFEFKNKDCSLTITPPEIIKLFVVLRVSKNNWPRYDEGFLETAKKRAPKWDPFSGPEPKYLKAMTDHNASADRDMLPEGTFLTTLLVDVDDLIKGIYYVTVTKDGGYHIAKFVSAGDNTLTFKYNNPRYPEQTTIDLSDVVELLVVMRRNIPSGRAAA
jgi:hypothetical protein